ncbi:hypothetical protein BD324DRAFT_649166 [Kockovaella imperatae]|uniref:Uncharacterized protein n=1 Tax=Kockovaella imperatae TaxID=4999 RepID=A0A1Y1UNK9_9TREE|nr:hypothetical protein BD324DRAFT_649166 [Kockovaella imperatae]ORX39074.1 hypothetical protein BD324DRAFT_649166 [Kockovaella imperatae]
MGDGLEVPQELVGSSALYNSPDPLLRRLRLQDSNGQDILDLNRYFRHKEVLVLYAGSEGGSSIANLKELHRDLSTLAFKEIKTCAIIYISTDTDASAMPRITANVPWTRMIFADNSDFAPPVRFSESPKIVEIEDVARGEDFIQAGEIEVGAEKIEFGREEFQFDYVRPLSRAAVTALMHAYATPSIAIYHIPSHQILSRNVRPSAFTPSNIGKNYHTWRNGGSPSIRVIDILARLKWYLFILFLSLSYRLLTHFGGDQYNFIPQFMDMISWRGPQNAGVIL